INSISDFLKIIEMIPQDKHENFVVEYKGKGNNFIINLYQKGSIEEKKELLKILPANTIPVIATRLEKIDTISTPQEAANVFKNVHFINSGKS
ncbi:MAG: hypothetical protein ACR2HS_01790, partial [Gammaproteobacteria bacterium]